MRTAKERDRYLKLFEYLSKDRFDLECDQQDCNRCRIVKNGRELCALEKIEKGNLDRIATIKKLLAEALELKPIIEQTREMIIRERR